MMDEQLVHDTYPGAFNIGVRVIKNDGCTDRLLRLATEMKG